jgi:hypothetical protein
MTDLPTSPDARKMTAAEFRLAKKQLAADAEKRSAAWQRGASQRAIDKAQAAINAKPEKGK